MPLFLIVIGIILVVTAINNTSFDLFHQVRTDFPGFVPWAFALILAGSLGYISDSIKPISGALVALVILVLMLSHAGFFKQLTDAFHIPTA